MDRQLAERMVGAACLLAVLVLVVPAILDGNPDSDATITHPAVEEELDLRTHTIRLDGAEREPPVPMPVQAQGAPEPAAPQPTAPQPATSQPATSQPPEEPAPAVVAPKAAPKSTVTPAEPETAAATEKTPTEGGGDWIVQLGSFSSRANADRLAADVRGKGFTVSVQGGGGASGSLFRVRAGPEAEKSGAEALAARLTAAGFKGGRVGRLN